MTPAPSVIAVIRLKLLNLFFVVIVSQLSERIDCFQQVGRKPVARVSEDYRERKIFCEVAYSERRASIGSTLVARRAGNQQASNAMVNWMNGNYALC